MGASPKSIGLVTVERRTAVRLVTEWKPSRSSRSLVVRLRWPEKAYLIDRVHRFIYCPIPKVACSSILHWCLAVSGESDVAPGKKVHQYVRDHRTLRACGWWTARRALRDSTYYRFVFVRQPYSRLVSAYVNKFLRATSPAWPVIRAIQSEQAGGLSGTARRWLSRWTRAERRPLSAAEADRSVTFRQFVEFITGQPPRTLDVHWRPQHLFLGSHAFDLVGRFECLQMDFAVVQKALDIRLPLAAANQSSYEDRGHSGESVADWEPTRLRQLPALPPWRAFFTADLEERVQRYYAEDFRQFGYSSELNATGNLAADLPSGNRRRVPAMDRDAASLRRAA